MTSYNSDPAKHVLECVQVHKGDLGDLAFELRCNDCGFQITIPLLEVFTQRELSISHAEDPSGRRCLIITFPDVSEDLPPAIRDFLETLE